MGPLTDMGAQKPDAIKSTKARLLINMLTGVTLPINLNTDIRTNRLPVNINKCIIKI